MRRRMMIALILCSVRLASASDIVIQKVRGEVSVRQGVTEVWNRVAVGDALRPDDTMKTGSKSSATILITGDAVNGTAKSLTLPANVMVDISDVRELTQEELMLRLAMERVRSAPYEWKNNDFNLPNTSVVHGTDAGAAGAPPENDAATGYLQINGTRVLFDNGFYSTCALKSMEIFRLYPSLGEIFDNRLMVAEALERAQLKGEALSEYGSTLRLPDLTKDQETIVRSKIAQLRK
jgi:hypothetical protein